MNGDWNYNKKALNQHTEYIKLGKWLVDVFVFAIKWAIPLRMQENHYHTAKTPFFALMTSAVFFVCVCFSHFEETRYNQLLHMIYHDPDDECSGMFVSDQHHLRMEVLMGKRSVFRGNFMYNGHLWWVFPWQMVIFHSFLYVYQRVALVTLRVFWNMFFCLETLESQSWLWLCHVLRSAARW